MQASERRRQLLEVAADLFARHGYRGTTTARLANAAGVTEPILYRHFENKRALFMTLVNEVGSEVIDAWRNALEGRDAAEERLQILLAGNPATNERGRDVYRVIFQAMTEVEDDPELQPVLAEHIEQLHRFIANELGDLQASGVVRSDRSEESLAWLLIDVAIGYGLSAPLAGDRSRSEVRKTLEAMLRG
jgi:AcrR family transcriptional regulator